MIGRDLTGKRFGRWEVLEPCVRDVKDERWLCACECGTKKPVKVHNLLRGASRSCGCLKVDMQTKHGLSKDPLYKTWVSLRQRVTDTACRDYTNYGGRGITMEPEWQHDFKAFRDWVVENLGPKPSPTHSIDRKNNEFGGYIKGNLRWATVIEQQNNRRSNRLIEFRGDTLNLKQWCTKLGVNYGAVKMRLNAMGWTIEQALTIPTAGRHRKARQCVVHQNPQHSNAL